MEYVDWRVRKCWTKISRGRVCWGQSSGEQLMNRIGHVSLEQYAHRRFVLSGTSNVKDHYPYCKPMESVNQLSKPIASFGHYDYLAISSDPRLHAAAIEAVQAVGVGVGASRLVGGERDVHRSLERDFAEFLGVEDTLALVSGYGTNVTLVSHILSRGDLIVVDESSHNSLMAGAQLSRASAVTFRHNDLDHLAAILTQKRNDYGRTLVLVEGLYSMDGDIPDLPRLLEICREHKAWLLVDEAHSIGVLGKTGRGVTEHFGIDPSEVDLIVGTLSKAFASCGGFIAGKRQVIDWLRFTLPGFVYSVGLTPPTAATARAALRILRDEPERLAALHDNSRYFLEGAKRRGLDVGSAVGSAVVPVLFADTPSAINAGKAALDAGFFVPPIVQIAIPKNAPRMRFFLTAAHDQSQIDGVLDCLAPFAIERPFDLIDGQLEAFGSPARAWA